MSFCSISNLIDTTAHHRCEQRRYASHNKDNPANETVSIAGILFCEVTISGVWLFSTVVVANYFRERYNYSATLQCTADDPGQE
jgi:hypothetical protein